VAVTPSYLAHVVEQLSRVLSAVRSRRMFGEAGLYSGEAFFAVVADDALYFKVDDTSRADFEVRGMPPFRPYGDSRASMHYYQVPEEVFEDPEVLRAWAERAIAVAREKKGRSTRRRGA
jgi:DNA transformation protein and related proteins